MPAWERPDERFWAVSPGSAASSTCSRMRGHMCPNKPCGWKWQQISGPCSMPRTDKTAEEFLQAAIQKYAVSAPRLSAWLEENLAEGFTVFDFPLEHRRSIRTTNSLERINKEIRRRTRVVGVFPNEASCLRLVSALLMETSEEWQIGKHYCAGKSFDC